MTTLSKQYISFNVLDRHNNVNSSAFCSATIGQEPTLSK